MVCEESKPKTMKPEKKEKTEMAIASVALILFWKNLTRTPTLHAPSSLYFMCTRWKQLDATTVSAASKSLNCKTRTLIFISYYDKPVS